MFTCGAFSILMQYDTKVQSVFGSINTRYSLFTINVLLSKCSDEMSCSSTLYLFSHIMGDVKFQNENMMDEVQHCPTVPIGVHPQCVSSVTSYTSCLTEAEMMSNPLENLLVIFVPLFFVCVF